MDRGVALLNQWKVSEGIEDFNKSIELYRKLVSDGTVDEKKLVKVISFRAAALNKNGNLDKAIHGLVNKVYDNSISLTLNNKTCLGIKDGLIEFIQQHKRRENSCYSDYQCCSIM